MVERGLGEDGRGLRSETLKMNFWMKTLSWKMESNLRVTCLKLSLQTLLITVMRVMLMLLSMRTHMMEVMRACWRNEGG